MPPPDDDDDTQTFDERAGQMFDVPFDERAGQMFDAPFNERAGQMFDEGAADSREGGGAPPWMQGAMRVAPGAAAALDGGGSGDNDLIANLKEMQAKNDKLEADKKAALDPLYKQVHGMIDQPTPEVPTLDKSPKSPTQQIGQGAMEFLQVATVFGALGGLLARRGTTTSLNAFGAAIKGFTEGNMQVYKSKYEEWKAATQETQQNNQNKLDQYNAIWKDRKMNIDQKMEEMKIVASQYGDEIVHNLSTQRNYTAVAGAIQKQQEMQIRLGTTADRQIRQNEAWQLKLDETKAKHDNAKAIAEAIMSGEQPPTTTGLYGLSGEVRGELARRGYNQTQALLEYSEVQKQIISFNSSQMLRFNSLAKSVVNTIDRVKETSEELKNSGFPEVNRLKLAAIENLKGNSPKGQLVAKYQVDVNTLIEEYANLANGGYAPTEPAWKLAHQQISAIFGDKQLGAALDETQKLINYRINAFQEVKDQGNNRYKQKPAEPTGPMAKPPAAKKQDNPLELPGL